MASRTYSVTELVGTSSEGLEQAIRNGISATAAAIRSGWLHTGDLVHVRADGSMKLVDRIKDAIITGGGTCTPPRLSRH